MKKTNQFLLFLKNEQFFGLLGWWWGAIILLNSTTLGSFSSRNYNFLRGEVVFICFFIFMLVVWILAPWLMSRNGAPGLSLDYREFFFTRAINRRTYFRSKVATYLVLILSPFLLVLTVSFYHPTLTIEPSFCYTERYLENFSESYVITDPSSRHKGKIVIPSGRPVKDLWVLWKIILFSIGFQGFIIAIARYRFGKQLVWLGLIIPLLGTVFPLLLSGATEGFMHLAMMRENSFL